MSKKIIYFSSSLSRQEKIMLCLKYVGIIDLQKFLLISIIFLLKIVIMKIVSFTLKLSNSFNRILLSFVFILHSRLRCVIVATSVNVYINHCIMCLVKCHSFSLSFFFYEASKREFF